MNHTAVSYIKRSKSVPAEQYNHLFFASQCVISAYQAKRLKGCSNSCASAMGNPENTSVPWSYDFFPSTRRLWKMATNVDTSAEDSVVIPGSDYLSVKYCLAEPLSGNCRVGLSPTLLIVVTICVIIKTATAILVTTVLSRRRHVSLVTLGDAIASFIQVPDPTTIGDCTLDQPKIQYTLHIVDISI